MRLYPRFLLVLFFVAVVPLSIFGIRVIQDARLIDAQTRQFQKYMVEAHVQQVSQFFRALNLSLSFIADLEQRPRMPTGERQAILLAALTNRRDFDAIAVLREDGRELEKVASERYSKVPFVPHTEQAAFHQAALSRQLQIGAPFWHAGHTWVRIYYPLSDGPVIFIAATLDPLLERLRAVHVGASGSLWLFDESDTRVLGPGSPSRDFSPSFLRSVTALAHADVGNAEDQVATLSTGSVAGAVSLIPQMGWTLAFLQERSEAFEISRQIKANLLFWIIVAGLGVALGAWRLTQDLARPLQTLAKAAARVAHNKLDIEIQPHGPAEIKHLLETFNTMTRHLREFQDLQVDVVVAERTKLQAIVQRISDGILIVDFQGRLIFWNQQAEDLLGNPALGEGSSLEAVILSDEMRQPIRQAMAGHLPQATFKAQIQVKDEKRTLAGTVLRLRTDKGKDLGVMVAMRDASRDE